MNIYYHEGPENNYAIVEYKEEEIELIQSTIRLLDVFKITTKWEIEFIDEHIDKNGMGCGGEVIFSVSNEKDYNEFVEVFNAKKQEIIECLKTEISDSE